MDYYQDIWGNYVFNDGTSLSLNDLIARGIDVTGAWLSRSPYVSPDDPRYQQRNNYPYGYPQTVPVRTGQGTDFAVGGSLSPTGGLRTNVQVSPWLLMLGGLFVGAIFFGKGRR